MCSVWEVDVGGNGARAKRDFRGGRRRSECGPRFVPCEVAHSEHVKVRFESGCEDFLASKLWTWIGKLENS